MQRKFPSENIETINISEKNSSKSSTPVTKRKRPRSSIDEPPGGISASSFPFENQKPAKKLVDSTLTNYSSFLNTVSTPFEWIASIPKYFANLISGNRLSWTLLPACSPAAVILKAEDTVRVDDPTMGYICDSSTLHAISSGLRSNSKPSKGWPFLLLYGHPGCGKTRALKELAAACNNIDHPLRTILMEEGVDLTDWLPLSITFNSSTAVCDEDASLFEADPILPLLARLIFGYCETKFRWYEFPEFIKLMMSLPRNHIFGTTLTLDLLDRILQHFNSRRSTSNSGSCSSSDQAKQQQQRPQKQHILLLLDENVHLTRALTGQALEKFIATVNRLQDGDEARQVRVVWTGLLDGPWLSCTSPSGRLLIRNLLPPLPDNSDGLSLLLEDDIKIGLQKIAEHYASRGSSSSSSSSSSTSTDKTVLLAKHIFYYTCGLPRAIEIVRQELASCTCLTLDELYQKCSELLGERYPAAPSEEAVQIALLGLPILNQKIVPASGSRETPRNAVSIRAHTAMSTGEVMLKATEAGGNNDQLLLPPLRLNASLMREVLRNFRNLSRMIVCSNRLSAQQFEEVLFLHELQLRLVRRWVLKNEQTQNAVRAPNYRDMTLGKLYCGRTGSTGDITANWISEELVLKRFNFCRPLRSVRTEKGFPTYDERFQYKNHAVFPRHPTTEGFEFGLVLEASDGDIVVVAVQTKFTEIEAAQDSYGVGQAVAKVEKALCSLESTIFWPKDFKEEKESKLLWPKSKVVVLMMTNRPRQKYHSVVDGHNLILLCKESLQAFLGPTVWAILAASEALSGLRRGGSDDDEVEDEDDWRDYESPSEDGTD